MLLATVYDCMDAAANNDLPEMLVWVPPATLEDIRSHFSASPVASALVTKLSDYASQSGLSWPLADPVSDEILAAVDEDECVTFAEEVEQSDINALEQHVRKTLLDMTLLAAHGALSGGLLSFTSTEASGE